MLPFDVSSLVVFDALPAKVVVPAAHAKIHISEGRAITTAHYMYVKGTETNT